MARWKFSQFHFALLVLTISVGINFLQARYISTLLDKGDQALAKGKLAVGVRLPPLEVSNLAGVRSTVSYSAVSKPTLLYIFRPSCVWCQRNAGALKALVERVSGRCRVIGISLSEDGLPDFVASHGMGFPVYSGLSRSAIDAYHLGATPETIVVSPNGVVLGSWDGAYTQRTKAALESFFAISFPPQSLVSDQASF